MGIYLFKVNYLNTWLTCEICSNLAIKTPEQLNLNRFHALILLRHVSIAEFEQLNICRECKSWERFFISPEPPMVLSSLGTFLGQHHNLQILGMSNWLIWSLANFTDQLLVVLKCKMFLKFKMFFLVSPDRDILRPWNFPKYVPLTKEVDWWKHF